MSKSSLSSERSCQNSENETTENQQEKRIQCNLPPTSCCKPRLPVPDQCQRDSRRSPAPDLTRSPHPPAAVSGPKPWRRVLGGSGRTEPLTLCWSALITCVDLQSPYEINRKTFGQLARCVQRRVVKSHRFTNPVKDAEQEVSQLMTRWTPIPHCHTIKFPPEDNNDWFQESNTRCNCS